MTDLPRKVANEQGVHLAVIFRLAFEYAEVRINPKRLHELYNAYLVNDEVPRCVNNFALDVLAGRVSIPRATVRRAK